MLQWDCDALQLHTGNFFEILLNLIEIRLYISFSDWFQIKQMSVWFQINWKMVNTIWFRGRISTNQKARFVLVRKSQRVRQWVFVCLFVYTTLLSDHRGPPTAAFRGAHPLPLISPWGVSSRDMVESPTQRSWFPITDIKRERERIYLALQLQVVKP